MILSNLFTIVLCVVTVTVIIRIKRGQEFREWGSLLVKTGPGSGSGGLFYFTRIPSLLFSLFNIWNLLETSHDVCLLYSVQEHYSICNWILVKGHFYNLCYLLSAIVALINNERISGWMDDRLTHDSEWPSVISQSTVMMILINCLNIICNTEVAANPLKLFCTVQ